MNPIRALTEPGRFRVAVRRCTRHGIAPSGWPRSGESGVRVRAERLYQQLDVLQPVREQARHDLLLESQASCREVTSSDSRRKGEGVGKRWPRSFGPRQSLCFRSSWGEKTSTNSSTSNPNRNKRCAASPISLLVDEEDYCRKQDLNFAPRPSGYFSMRPRSSVMEAFGSWYCASRRRKPCL